MFNKLYIFCEDETEYQRVRELFAAKGLSWASGDSLLDEGFEDNLFDPDERDVLTHNKFIDLNGEVEEYITYDATSDINIEEYEEIYTKEHIYAKEFLSRHHPTRQPLKNTKLPLI